jgi:hypothetical protein
VIATYDSMIRGNMGTDPDLSFEARLWVCGDQSFCVARASLFRPGRGLEVKVVGCVEAWEVDR